MDFGCANLGLLPYVKNLAGVEEIFFVDVDKQILEQYEIRAAPLLTDHIDRETRLKIEICEGSVTYNDKKLEKTDAVVCIELYVTLYERNLIRIVSLAFLFLFLSSFIRTLKCVSSLFYLKKMCFNFRIEHLYPSELLDLPANIFAYIKPKVVIITTPNVEFNVLFPNPREFRHPDHKFEWTRKQFEDW